MLLPHALNAYVMHYHLIRVIISPITSGSDIPRNADRTTLIKCDLKSIEIHQGDNTTRQISYEILTEHLNYMKSLL
jgi:hypothetical protein